MAAGRRIRRPRPRVRRLGRPFRLRRRVPGEGTQVASPQRKETIVGMSRRFHDSVVYVAAMALLTIVPNAWSQSAAADEWRHGTTLAGFVGAASASPGAGVAAGAALGWEITPHFTLEGRGTWFDAGRRADAFTALLGARVPLRPGRSAVPFLSGGMGVYRATFDSMSGTVPGFYQRRMRARSAGFEGRTFDDFVVAIGGGADVFLASHLALRPEITVLVVTTRAETRTVPAFGVHVAYHFDSHPITPGGR